MQIQKLAKYLLRFDDICPTMNWQKWSAIEAALLEHRIKPILAVVPDNQSKTLKVDPPAADFWERVRQWQDRGWCIGLHGYQHLCIGEHTGFAAPKKKTEFAGLPAAAQEEMLRRGIEIFHREGITPHAWIAPWNSFDATTVKLLPQFGIRIISDGLFRFPYVDEHGIFWVPHQIFQFRRVPRGVWTVGFHHNLWSESDLDRFRQCLGKLRPDISSLDEVQKVWGKRKSAMSAWLCAHPRFSAQLLRVKLKLWDVWFWREAPYVSKALTMNRTETSESHDPFLKPQRKRLARLRHRFAAKAGHSSH